MNDSETGLQQHPPSRPTIYNRPWHVDQDDRRHHGRRRWDPATIETLVEMLSSLDGLYPPDWSDRDAVRLRAAGATEPFAELWTDKPSTLRLILHLSPPPTFAIAGCRIHVDDERCEVLVNTPGPIRTPAFAALVRAAVAQASKHFRPA